MRTSDDPDDTTSPEHGTSLLIKEFGSTSYNTPLSHRRNLLPNWRFPSGTIEFRSKKGKFMMIQHSEQIRIMIIGL